MSDGKLVFLPLPFLAAFLCGAVAIMVWRLELGNARSRILFVMLFALFALESVLVGIRFGYRIDYLIPLQRILPLFAGPLMYLGFLALTPALQRMKKHVIWHLSYVFAVIVLFQIAPWLFDYWDIPIAASYGGYAALLVLLWRKGADHLIHARLEMAGNILRWMLWGAGLLAFLLTLDSAIALNFALNSGDQAPAIISYSTVFIILLLLAIILAIPKMLVAVPNRPLPLPLEEGSQVEQDARALLLTTQIYLDPELSAQRLAKRLHIPMRSLSAAINQSQGMNVSQYVNGFRLSHAADLLTTSDENVAAVMQRSGFLTRSNFYREFKRVYGQTPASFRRSFKPEGKAFIQ